jgi:hypothetical protein
MAVTVEKRVGEINKNSGKNLIISPALNTITKGVFEAMIRQILVMGSEWNAERIRKQYEKNDVQRFEQFWEVMEYLQENGETVDAVFFTERVRHFAFEDITFMIRMAYPKIKVHIEAA